MDWINGLFTVHSAIQTVVVLSLICYLGLILGKIRVKGISLGVAFVFFIGIIAGFVFYVSNITFGNMTLVFTWIPTFIGALIPSLICLTIVWWLLAKKRD